MNTLLSPAAGRWRVQNRPDEVIILAGGRGERLRQVVPHLPKPMAPVGGRPFLASLLDWVQGQGVRRAILSVGYRHEAIVDYFGSRYRDLDLVYAIEEHPLGTAGGVALGLRSVQGEAVFLLNGDTFCSVALEELVLACRRLETGLAMAVRPVAACGRYGAVQVKEGVVTGFEEKGREGAGLINGGVFLLHAELGQELTGMFSFESEFLQPNLARLRIAAVPTDGYFIDIGVPADYALVEGGLPPGVLEGRR